MSRLASNRLPSLLPLLPLLAACAMPVGEGDASSDAVRAAEQPLSAAERRERAALIRDLFAEQGITQGWLAAGLADAETMMTHCRYGETGYWERAGCSGPESAECGGPVLAGGGDGPCSLREGGLGMFQFDAGDFDETLAREGRGILSLEGNIRSAVRFVVDMVERSTYIPGVRSRADAIRWLNGVEGPDDPDFEAWVQTVTHYYNGCRPGRCSVYASRYDHYATNARNMWSEMGGAAFWTEAPVGAVDEDGLDPRVPPAEPTGPSVSDALGEHRGGCTTAGFATLSRQLAEHQGCLFPDHALIEVRHPNVRVASERVHLFFEAETAAALQRAAEEVPLTVTSGFRTVADQYALARRGGCPAVARPGSSWHQSGRAVDVANYGEARAAMERAGFRWYGAGDPVHFTGPGSDRRSRSVLAFQNLWNLNHPEDPIAEDGLWGPDTEARLRRAPMGGFPRTGCGCTPHCEGGVAVDASCGRTDCGGVTCVEEGGAARCAEVPTEAPGCDGLTTCLEHFGGLACFDEHEEVLACGHHGGGVACFDACGGAPDVCPEALACWRGGGGGACFRPERCGLEEAPEPAPEPVPEVACADLRLASPELGLRRMAFLVACADHREEILRLRSDGSSALLPLDEAASALFRRIAPGHGAVTHVYVRGGGDDAPLVVFTFAGAHEGWAPSERPWDSAGRAAVGYALDALPHPHLERLAREIVDLVAAGAAIEWRVPTPWDDLPIDERVAEGLEASAERVAADPSGGALLFTDAALAERGLTALDLASVVGALLEEGARGRVFPSELVDAVFEVCRVLDVPVPFCARVREGVELLGRREGAGPRAAAGVLYQHAVGATEILREDATYQRGAPRETLYGEPGGAMGRRARSACARWALCGDDASDADGDGVTWTAGEGDCSDLNPADAAGGCAPDVDDPCAAHADCGSCNEAIGCGWCGATGTCASDGRRGACGGDWRGSPSSCVDCSAHATCDSCVDDGFCGWCPGVGCLNDHTEAAVACGEAYSVLACM